MTVSNAIKTLVKYGVKEGLLDVLDEKWAVNRLLEIMELPQPAEMTGHSLVELK